MADSPSPEFAFSSSPSPCTPSSESLPSWHFPGPSSVFHKREKDATRHRRGESYTTPIAPALSTERRAQHRRVQSSASFAGALSPLPTTPGASEKGRSPLSRFASYTSATMAATDPLTPAKSIASSRPGSKLQDSPFSDYFTDDGRSSHEHGYSAPSPEAQRMLLRLNKLQSQIMRGADGEAESEALNIVGKNLDSLDLELGSLHSQHSQTRMPMEDSGLFLEEGEEAAEGETTVTPSGLGVQYDGAQDGVLEEEPTEEQRQAEHDYLLVQAQQVLANVSKAQQRLKQRHAELRELNDAHATELDDKDRQIEELKSENEAMQMDLNHDHSELLFLKLQFKALEVEVDALEDDAPAIATPVQRKKLQEDMDRWRSDWADVDGRMKRRRSRYGIVSPQTRRDSHAEAGAVADDWQLRTVKRGHGRVQSIVIQRTTSAGYSLGLDGANDFEDEQIERLSYRTSSTNTSNSTQTAGYATQGTQTESAARSELFSDDDCEMPALEDDYAITTSSEYDESEYRDFAEDEKPVKSAWQDLWDGLSSLAGMGDERFE